MRIGNLLKLFEDLIFDLLSWVIFIPKTFILALAPGKGHVYVQEQWKLSEEEKYDATVTPIIFYIAMIFFGVLTVIWDRGFTTIEYFKQLLSLSDLGMFSVFISAFMQPLVFTILLQLGQSMRSKKPFGRQSFRQKFDVQCLLWGVFVAIGPILWFFPKAPIDRLFKSVPFLFFALPMLYLSWLETKTIEEEFKISKRSAFLIAAVLAFAVNTIVVEILGDIYAPLFNI